MQQWEYMWRMPWKQRRMHTMCIRWIDNERYHPTTIQQRLFKELHNFATTTLRWHPTACASRREGLGWCPPLSARRACSCAWTVAQRTFDKKSRANAWALRLCSGYWMPFEPIRRFLQAWSQSAWRNKGRSRGVRKVQSVPPCVDWCVLHYRQA